MQGGCSMRYKIVVIPLAAVGGWYLLKRMAHRGGAIDAEVQMPLPGDAVVVDPMVQTTHGVTIAAPAAALWPWLVQMGYYRPGWYTDPSGWWNRWIDPFLFLLLSKEEKGTAKPRTERTADHIIPEYQNLKVGDVIADGPPGTAYFTVTDLEPNRALILHSTSHVRYIVPSAREEPTFP
jgi:hypothetical protein